MPKLYTSIPRRNFLAQSAAVAATLLTTGHRAQAEQATSVAQSLIPADPTAHPVPIPNRDTVLKFNPDGSVRPFAGNTVICHLPVQSAMRNAMTALHDQLAASSLRPKLGLTTTASYHMTIFNGADDLDRHITGWPSYVPLDASMETCNQMVGARMASAHLHSELPIRVRVNQAATLAHPTACTLRMEPADAGESIKLQSIREQLAAIFGIHRESDDHYSFHITMSYQIATFSDKETVTYRQMLREHMLRIVETTPVLELGNPEFCTFPNMSWFEPKKLLACS